MPQAENANGEVVNINAAVESLKGKAGMILGLHALTGCDSTSFIYGKGKASAIPVLLKCDIDLSVIGDLHTPIEEVVKVGKQFISLLYKGDPKLPLNVQ